MQIENILSLGRVLVTGGTGFVGAYLVKRLVKEGLQVRVFDNNTRGNLSRLGSCLDQVDFINGDITRFEDVASACEGIDTIFHLAFINGTDNFYNFPEKVLEVGVKGAIHTLDAAIEKGIKNYIVTSSSEVYQEPTHIPTSEKERIIIPDINNPRFSYSGGKIITELLAIHYAAKTDLKTIICRPHNFYGADMGMGHVIPQFVDRMKKIAGDTKAKEIDFPIQGDGTETRAFCYVDDAVDGLILCTLKGKNREIYHIGTEEEVSIEQLACMVGEEMGMKVNIKRGDLLPGGTSRRCPDIRKARSLGYAPSISLKEGLGKTVNWYMNNCDSSMKISKGEIVR